MYCWPTILHLASIGSHNVVKFGGWLASLHCVISQQDTPTALCWRDLRWTSGRTEKLLCWGLSELVIILILIIDLSVKLFKKTCLYMHSEVWPEEFWLYLSLSPWFPIINWRIIFCPCYWSWTNWNHNQVTWIFITTKCANSNFVDQNK